MKKPTFNEWLAPIAPRLPTPPWSALCKAILGEDMTEEDIAHYKRLSGGLDPAPAGGEGLTRALIVAGRRANKSETIARLALYEVLHGGHEFHLAPGEIGYFAIVSPRRDSGDAIMNYIKGLLEHKSIKSKIDGKATADEVRFKSGLSIQIVTADAVAVRGKSLIGCIIEEAAQLDSVRGTPSEEIIGAIEPALLRMGAAPPRRLISITSAYIKQGSAWKTFKAGYGVPGAAWAVFQATTPEMNPSVPLSDLETAEKSDPIRFRREFLSEWQDSISTESYFGWSHVEASIDKGRGSLPWTDGMRVIAAMDPALRRDSWALVVGWHRTTAEGKNIVEIAHVESWTAPPGGSLDPDAVIQKIAFVLRSRWGVKRIFSDQFHGASLKKIGRDYGLTIVEKPWSAGGEESKALQYQKAHELMRTGGLRLPEHQGLVIELKGIRSKLLPSGTEQIQASGSGHDDLVSALVMAISECQKLPPTKKPADKTAWERHEEEMRSEGLASVFGSAGYNFGIKKKS